jgi:hypothetical protein
VATWKEWGTGIIEIVQHTLTVITIIVCLAATGRVSAWVLPEDNWFRRALPVLEDYAFLGLAIVLLITLVWHFIKKPPSSPKHVVLV